MTQQETNRELDGERHAIAPDELEPIAVIAFLDAEISETERCIKARRQAAETWRGCDERMWKEVGCELNKDSRLEMSKREERIAEKYHRDLVFLRAIRKHFSEHSDTEQLDSARARIAELEGLLAKFGSLDEACSVKAFHILHSDERREALEAIYAEARRLAQGTNQ